ncbi:hypothetical protein AB0K87_02000 [Streptomyces sp. NPDC053705]|uniref:hypothetical protein n=1 Tax=Streptomyces sp. NPDC053705 TaxID=3156668 RepID=UPI003442AFEA
MNTQAVIINGTETTLFSTDSLNWSAGDLTLRLRPNMTWRATRNERAAIGATAQEAVDALAGLEAKTQRAANLAARSTKGQVFAREMRTYLHIGARTRRFNSKKWQQDGHRDVLSLIAEANNEPGMRNVEREAIFQTAYAALCSWEKHIDGYRADAVLVAHINNMTPYQFCALLGDMIDAEISNVGQGERFFRSMTGRLYAQAA